MAELNGIDAVIALNIFEDGGDFGIVHVSGWDAWRAGIDEDVIFVEFFRFFEDGDKEALGIVFPRGDAARFFDFRCKSSAVVFGDSMSEMDSGDIVHFDEFEGISAEEFIDDGFIFIGIEGACGVDDPPADFEQTRAGEEDSVLLLVLGFGIFRCFEAITAFAEGIDVSETRAGNIGEDAVEDGGENMREAFGGHVIEDGVGDDHGVESGGERCHAFSGEIIGIKAAFILHCGCDLACF